MNDLTEEEVLHVAHLGRLSLSKEEIEKYKHQLKQILNDINKINEVVINDNIMISPSENSNVFSDNSYKEIDTKSALSNAPTTKGNYIEVRWLKND